MAKVAVVFWSGTGHTEKMAHCIMDGLKAGGAEAELFTVSQFSADKLDSYDKIAFGLLLSKINFQAAKLHCSVLTNGQTVNGCRHG